MADFILQIITTHNCNLKCSHCYGNFGFKEDELTTNILQEVLKDFKKLCDLLKMGAIVHFSGGEPLLREDIFNNIAYSKNLGIKTVLLTNGLLISKLTALKLEESGLDSCQISLESTKKEIHEKIRGKNTFDKTIKCALLLKEKTSIEVSLGMAVMKCNLNEVDDYSKLTIEKLKLDRAVFHRFVPMGRGRIEEKISPKEHDFFLDKIIKLKKKYGEEKIIYTDPLLYSKICGLPTNSSKIGGCSAGFAALSLDSNGDLMPCPRLNIKVGNIYENNIIYLYFNSEILKRIRNRENLKGKCKNCMFKYQCGGCRAYTYSVSKDLFSEDPLCMR